MKRLLAFGLLLAFTALCVSCSAVSGTQTGATKSDSLKSGGSKELTMYVMDYDTTTQKAVEEFNSTHKDVQIKVTSLVAIPADNLGSKLMYGFNSGGGPDIILCEQNTLPNLSVFFNKGAFYDLNTLLDNDKTFRKSDFFEKVLDYGIYKGKRYVIPLSFKIDALFTTEELLGKSGQGITDKGTGLDAFVEASQKHLAGRKDGESCFLSEVSFGSLMQTAAEPFFNLEAKTEKLNSKEFSSLLEKYKTLCESTCPQVMITTLTQKYDLLPEGKAVFLNMQTMGPKFVTWPYSNFASEAEPVLIPAPYAGNDRHIIAKPEKYIGISSKCGNVGAACDFLKLLLSKDYQDAELVEGIPVSREAYEQQKENCLKGMSGYDFWKKGGCQSTETLKKLYTQLDQLISGIDRCWTTDEYLLSLVRKEVDSYLSTGVKIDFVIKNIVEKVDAYLKSGVILDSLNKEDDTPTDPAKTVSLYYWDDIDYMLCAEYAFNQKYPDYHIKKKIIPSLGEFYKTTAVEIMAGGGPDIVIFDPRWYNSIPKVVESGAFCEMDEFIEKYEILNDDYNKNLIKEGIYNGKRYYIPLYYQFDTFVSTKEILAKNNINIDQKNWTWDKFADCAREYMNKNKGKNKYFVSPIDFQAMIINCDVPLIDYANKKSNFDSEAFRKLLKTYKEIYPAINPEHTQDALQNGVVVMKNLTFGHPEAISILSQDYIKAGLGEMTVVKYPTLTGVQKNYVTQNDCIAVNSNCKNKDIAFKYVKIAASYEMQRDRDSRGVATTWLVTPVNDGSYRDDILSYPIGKKLPQLAEKLIEIRDTFEICNVREYHIRQMAQGIAEEYVKGNKTLEQAVKEIDGKVNMFLNE